MHYLIASAAGTMFTSILGWLGWLYGPPIYHTITDGNLTWPIWENPFKAEAMIEYADYFVSLQADRLFPSVIPGATSIGRPYIMDQATHANLTAIPEPPAPIYLNATYLRGNVYVTNLINNGTLQYPNPPSVNLLLSIVGFLAFVGAYLFFRNRRLSTELKSMSSVGKLAGKLFNATTDTDEAAVALLRRLKKEVQQLAPSQALDAAAFSSHMDYILAVVERANTSATDYDQTILKLHTLTGERDNLLQQLGAADESNRLALPSCLVLNTQVDLLKGEHAKTKDQHAKTAADRDAAWRIVQTQMQDADQIQGELEGVREECSQLQEDKTKLEERLEEQKSKPQPPSPLADDMTTSPGQKDAGQDVGSSEDPLAAPSGLDVEPIGRSDDGPASSSEDPLAAPSGSGVEPIGGSNDSPASLSEGSLDAPSGSDVEPIGGSDDSPSCPPSACPAGPSSSHDEPEPGAASGSDESSSSSEASTAAPSGPDVDPGSGSDELPASTNPPPASSPPPAEPAPAPSFGPAVLPSSGAAGSGSGSDSDHKSESSKDQPAPSDPPLSPASSRAGSSASESTTGTPPRLPLPLTFGATNPGTAQPESLRGGRGGGGGSPRVPGSLRRREPNIFIMPKRRGPAQQGGSSPLRPLDGDREGGVPSTRPNFDNNPLMQDAERLHGRWKQDMRAVGATEADWPKYMEFRVKKDEEAQAAQREGRPVVKKLEGYPDRWQM